MNREDFEVVLQKHSAWMREEEGGERANLQGEDLRRMNLRETNLREVDLWQTDLREADLRGADLDFSCWPLWCGSKGVKVDARIFRQLAMHLCGVEVEDDECRAAQSALMPLAQKCHRANVFFGKNAK